MSDLLDRLKRALEDRYAIQRELGQGGMATVYLARDLKLGRQVALKVLAPPVAAALGSERFLQEIRISANLQHAHIVPLFDSGEAGGTLFYVMPYVEGQSLRQLLDARHTIPLEEALGVTGAVASALDYAHKRGIVHRDIKPENILLRNGEPVVADFGIAKAMVSSSEAMQRTATGIVVGTPAYMSPEQVGGGARIDGRSDQYSLACVLFEMLTGSPPFVGASPHVVLAAHVAGSLPSVQSHGATLPNGVETVIHRALSKDPAERFPTAAAFVHALEGAVEGRRSTQLLPNNTWSYNRARRHLSWFGISALTLAGVVAIYLLGISPGDGGNEESRIMIAVLPFENLGRPEDQYFADGITVELTSRLASLGMLGVVSRTSAMRYKTRSMSLGDIARELGVRYVLEGAIRWDRMGSDISRVRITPQLIDVKSDTHVWAETFDALLNDIFEVQSDIAGRVATALDISLLSGEGRRLEIKAPTSVEAYDLYLRGLDLLDRHTTLAGLTEAAEFFKQAVGRDSTFAVALAGLSQTHATIYWLELDPTEERLALAREAADRAGAISPDDPDVLATQGFYHYWGHEDYVQALTLFAAALRARPSNAGVLGAVATIRWRQGLIDEAITGLQEVARLDPRSSSWPYALAIAYEQKRDYNTAERYYDQAIQLAPDQAMGYVGKALLYLLWRGGIMQARETIRQAEGRVNRDELIAEVASSDLMPIIMDSVSLSEVLRMTPTTFAADTGLYFVVKSGASELMGDSRRAMVYSDSARSILEGRVGRSLTISTGLFQSQLALAYVTLGLRDQAVAAARSATELEPISKDAVDGVIRAENLAVVYAQVGDLESAVDQLGFLLTVPSWISVPLLRVDPRWDPLRTNHRFQALLAKYETPRN